MRRRSLFRLLAALLLTTVLTFTLTSSIRAIERARRETERISGALNEQMARKLSECQRLGRKMAVMGADIRGAGTDVIKIRGVEHLYGTTYGIIPARPTAQSNAVCFCARSRIPPRAFRHAMPWERPRKRLRER